MEQKIKQAQPNTKVMLVLCKISFKFLAPPDPNAFETENI